MSAPNTSGRRWNQTVLTYNKSTPIIRVDNCKAYMVTNTGDTIAMFNGILLYPGVVGTSLGDSVTVGADEGDMYVGNLVLYFVPPINAAPAVQVVQTFYLDF